MGFDPLAFAGLYVLIGMLIGTTVIIVQGAEIIPPLQMLAEAEGIELGHVEAAVMLLVMFAFLWPTMISGDNDDFR